MIIRKPDAGYRFNPTEKNALFFRNRKNRALMKDRELSGLLFIQQPGQRVD